MAGKFEAYKSDGTLLFDTDRISYGLVKSGYLQLIERWPQKYLASIQLDPTDGGNYRNDALPGEPIFGITIHNFRSPIVFLVGDGSPTGEVTSGSTKTLLFVGASTSTKAYVFDLMFDGGAITGMKCYRESDGVLTFNSGQPPLNIIGAISPPALTPPSSSPQFPGFRGTPYSGGYNVHPGALISSDYPQIKGFGDVVLGSGEFAACITFTRSAGVCYGYNMGPPAGSNSGGRNYYYGAQEGAFGIQGGVRFMFCKSAATTRVQFSNQGSFWFDIPTDRVPQALVIKTASYPFPFN